MHLARRLPAAGGHAIAESMSNIAKLKKKGAELEARKNFEKALDVYEQVLTMKHTSDEDRDVALHNRVGDLHYRLGNTEQALTYYEQAADLYAEGGFFNNAIALCNKILRYAPGRTVIYYKLGLISAKKGFNSDAKQNFLEYADRMQRLGKMDEAFRALKEFADLCPGQDDVRLMLAEQLARANRKPEALEQLEVLYDTLLVEGRSGEATATLERMKTLDPAFKPRRSVTPRKREKEGLVFLDLDFDDAVPTARGASVQPPPDDDAPSPVASSSNVVPDAFVEIEKADEEIPEPSPEASSNQLRFITPAEPFAPGSGAPDEHAEDDSPLPFEEPAPAAVDEADARADDSTERAEDVPHLDLAPLVDLPETVAQDEEVYPQQDVDEIEHVEEVSFIGHSLTNGDASHVNGNGHADAPIALSPDDDFIDLGEWLEKNRTPSSTRMVAHDEEPENEEQKDFSEMLDKFKAGISKNVGDEDFESHYDLGIAFREMGLLDEAIGSFQKALNGPGQRVRAAEAIGQCFMDKGEAGVTMTVLERLVREPEMSDAQLVGVLYLLGRAAESLGRAGDAASYFQRVLAVQIGFRDTASRLTALAG